MNPSRAASSSLRGKSSRPETVARRRNRRFWRLRGKYSLEAWIGAALCITFPTLSKAERNSDFSYKIKVKKWNLWVTNLTLGILIWIITRVIVWSDSDRILWTAGFFNLFQFQKWVKFLNSTFLCRRIWSGFLRDPIRNRQFSLF